MTAFCRKLYKDFLYIPKHDKGRVREKVMLTRVALSVMVILLCMAAMSITAYAFFTHTTYSGVKPLQVASWSITVSCAEDVPPTEGSYRLDNTAGDAPRVYTFTVAKDAAATATVGYVKIVTTVDGSEQTYYTQPLGSFLLEGTMTEDPDRQVCIRVPAGKAVTVRFVGEWGSCSKEPVLEESDVIEPGAVGGASADTTTTTTTTTTAAPTTTTTTTTATQATTTTTVAETTTPENTTATTPALDEDTE